MTQVQQKLSYRPRFVWDAHLTTILVGSVLAGIVLWYVLPQGFAQGIAASPLAVVNILLLYPIIEELLFRGVIQGALLNHTILMTRHLGISRANLMTSMLFVGLHLVNHSPVWALAVLLPSLTLGHIKERYSTMLWPILLHILFNGIYLVAGS